MERITASGLTTQQTYRLAIEVGCTAETVRRVYDGHPRSTYRYDVEQAAIALGLPLPAFPRSRQEAA